MNKSVATILIEEPVIGNISPIVDVGFRLQYSLLLSRFFSPPESENEKRRWLTGLYPDTPAEMDDPYRFFRW
ncbi:MAG: hypothetical protein C4527_12450 [Candidatus Omnitrophota bacterium]|nr:MAG: hypothetical protein C4527_12450 [Candidatus Omnitrophota bacterium]